MKILFLLLSSLNCFGAITAVCDTGDSRCTGGTSVAITTVEGGPSDFGFKVLIGGSGTYTVANNDCFFNYAVSPASTGTAPATIYVLYTLSSNTLAPSDGPRTCHLQFAGGVTITIVETIVQKESMPFFSNPRHLADANIPNCYVFDAYQYFTCGDSITTLDPMPGGTRSNFPPAVGATWTDPALGGVFRRLTTSCAHTSYDNVSVSVDNMYLICQDNINGNAYKLYSNITTNPTDTGQTPACGGGDVQWSALHPTRFYCVTGTTTITQYHIAGGVIVSDGTIFTYPTGYGMGHQGASEVAKDDWLAVIPTGCRQSVCPSNPWVYAINLDSPNATVTEYVGYDLSTLPYRGTNTWGKCEVSVGYDKYTGRRYVMCHSGAGNTDNFARLFSFKRGDTTLTLENVDGFGTVDPTGYFQSTCKDNGYISSTCQVGGHGMLMEKEGEQCYIGAAISRTNPVYISMSGLLCFRGSNLAGTNKAAELGGGIHIRLMTSLDAGCARTGPVCAGNTNRAQIANKDSWRITNITGSSPFTITTATAHGLSPGDLILLGGVKGITLDGSSGPTWHFTVNTTPTSTSLTVSKATSGSYTSSTGTMTTDVEWASEDFKNNEIDVCRTDVRWCNRLAKAQNVGYSDSWTSPASAGGGYYDSPHTAITYDGKYVLTVCQGGIPDFIVDCLLPSGINVNQYTLKNHVDVNGNGLDYRVSDTSILFTCNSPNGTPCVLTFSANRNLSSSSSYTIPHRTSKLVTGLTASTPYYWRVVIDNYWSGIGEPTYTTVTQSGSSSVIWMTGKAPSSTDNAIVEYGTTTGLGSSTSSKSCSVGTNCSVSVTSLTKGTLYYSRLVWRDSGNAVLFKGPIVTNFAR